MSKRDESKKREKSGEGMEITGDVEKEEGRK